MNKLKKDNVYKYLQQYKNHQKVFPKQSLQKKRSQIENLYKTKTQTRRPLSMVVTLVSYRLDSGKAYFTGGNHEGDFDKAGKL
jgi:hypothetical protein